MLQGVTKAVAADPEAFDLLADPSDADAWRSGGGESFCDNVDFPAALAARWLEVLGKPAWAAALEKAELEFGDVEELETRLDELIAEAPEASDDDSSDDDDSSEEESD
ncbi:hypothetical protein HT031_003395 [Scenedesmus sp. PABB004]|nr:hypothetical protein HT031_003395 [Scenedesmus sp. PABB004]